MFPFVEGRYISDNILLCQELFRNYHRKDGVPRCAFKIDFRKAYDTIEWDFLFHTLSIIRFPYKFIQWVKTCVTTHYSVSLNGELVSFFKRERGLRQGDPISPYLFVLSLEVLNLILSRTLKNDKDFKFHWRCDKYIITYICSCLAVLL